jgi:hypothetical protein
MSRCGFCGAHRPLRTLLAAARRWLHPSVLPETEAAYDEPDDPNTLHIHPVNDSIGHILRDDCPCGPTAEPVPRPDGSYGWIVTHHSLDGREHQENP